MLVRAIRYAVERRRAEASLLRLREAAAARRRSPRAWSAACCPRRCWPAARSARASFYRSGRARSVIGGDFFDAVLGPSGTVHAIVGDVCGHGPDEAALGALLRVAWRALVLAGVDEPQLLPKLQQVLVSERHDRSLFTTAATVSLRPADANGRVEARVRLAGHPPPLVLGPRPDRRRPARSGCRWASAATASWAVAQVGARPGLGAAALHRRADRGPRRRAGRAALDRGLIGVLARGARHRPGPAARAAGRARRAAQRRRAASTTWRSCCSVRRRAVGRADARRPMAVAPGTPSAPPAPPPATRPGTACRSHEEARPCRPTPPPARGRPPSSSRRRAGRAERADSRTLRRVHRRRRPDRAAHGRGDRPARSRSPGSPRRAPLLDGVGPRCARTRPRRRAARPGDRRPRLRADPRGRLPRPLPRRPRATEAAALGVLRQHLAGRPEAAQVDAVERRRAGLAHAATPSRWPPRPPAGAGAADPARQAAVRRTCARRSTR